MTLVHLALAALLMFGPQPMEAVAAQLDLYHAKQQGLVGEMPSGTVGIIETPGTPELQNLVKLVNEGRLQSYKEIADKRGIPLAEVQKLAGMNLIEKTPPGQFVMSSNGEWVKKSGP
jgi:hypothetical protein